MWLWTSHFPSLNFGFFLCDWRKVKLISSGFKIIFCWGLKHSAWVLVGGGLGLSGWDSELPIPTLTRAFCFYLFYNQSSAEYFEGRKSSRLKENENHSASWSRRPSSSQILAAEGDNCLFSSPLAPSKWLRPRKETTPRCLSACCLLGGPHGSVPPMTRKLSLRVWYPL